MSSVHDPRVGGERRSRFCCLCRKEAPDQGNIKYCLHPAHQRLLYRTFDGHGLAAIDCATAISSQFLRGLRPLAPHLRSSLHLPALPFLMKVANSQHKYVLSSPTCLSHLTPFRSTFQIPGSGQSREWLS